MNKKIFIACDTTNLSLIKKIFKETKTNKLNINYKFGLEFFNSKKGRIFLSKVKNKIIWLDLKLFDIPNTVYYSILALKDLRNVRYLTIHASGGLEMMKAAKTAALKINKNIKILGVTVLTSFADKSLKKTGHTKSIKNLAIHQAKLSKEAGLDGIICSGREVKNLKKICKKMEIITPGIRLLGDKNQDQKRVMTPKSAFSNGATGIVIGRSITKGNIKNNMQKLIKSLN
jgi:orotidine-5'-phosphate decarboxylase|tara:strand:+ start:4771 stop:5460 length:690 start_codon:yes stop_codon:yes gene_type:complete